MTSPGLGWPVEVVGRRLLLADVEAWCAAMRGRGAADDAPVYAAEHEGVATRLSGHPGATVEGGPLPTVELDPGEYGPEHLADDFAVAVGTARATGRPAWVTEHGTPVAVILPAPRGRP